MRIAAQFLHSSSLILHALCTHMCEAFIIEVPKKNIAATECDEEIETIAFGMRILMVVPIFRNIYLIGIRISHYNDLNVSLHYSKEKCTHLFKKKNSKEEKFCSIPIYSYSIDYFY